ncbi:MAG: hypothetical protein M5U26_16770 [Planctomycetota bacterium]|nr:hypothetical protein [Planctomycetota bacterium]
MHKNPNLDHVQRLARVEVQLDQLVLATSRLHADLKEHLDWERSGREQLLARLVALERDAERTRAHLAWMKGIWLAVQAALAAWLGMAR